jgi:hypothetical protein
VNWVEREENRGDRPSIPLPKSSCSHAINLC